MTRYILHRIGGAIPTFLAIVVLVFLLLRLIPGDPVLALLPDSATDEQVAALRDHYGLNRSIPEQFLAYLSDAVRLDFGTSIRFGLPVRELIAERLPATIELALAAAVVAVVVAIPLGVLAGTKHGKWVDRVATTLGLVGISAPTFWVGLLLILYVGGTTGWFPTGGRLPSGLVSSGPTNFYLLNMLLHGDLHGAVLVFQHLALPAITLGLAMAGMLMRMTRSSLIEVLAEDYVRTAVAKGAGPMRVATFHSMRNALLPVVTVLGLELASLLSGSVIVESIFSWPGMGGLLITTVQARDYPVVQGCIMVFALVFIVCNLLVDLSYALIDPRIRF